jgi:hypothetical protein
MPQTEEEHLIGLEEENESIEGQPTDAHHNMEPDAEVSLQSGCRENKNCCQHQTLSWHSEVEKTCLAI